MNRAASAKHFSLNGCLLWSRIRWLGAVCVSVGTISIPAGEPGQHHERPHNSKQDSPTGAVVADASSRLPTTTLPPLPAGVTELKFSDFFVQPVGARGLELTEMLRRLDGKRVRILGYMVQPEKPVPGMFVLTAMPVRVNEERFGDDLPPAALFISMPKDRGQVVPYTPELMLLTGTLSVGNREEADDRVSTVRLALEIPEPAAKKKVHSSAKGAEQLMRRGK